MRLTIVLNSCFLHIICFLLVVFLLLSHHFSFFRHSLHVISFCFLLRLEFVCVFFSAKKYAIRMDVKHMFYVRIYVLFQIIESAGDQRDIQL